MGWERHLRSIEQISFDRKIELEAFTKDFKAILWVFEDPFLDYVRYQGKFNFGFKRGVSFDE